MSRSASTNTKKTPDSTCVRTAEASTTESKSTNVKGAAPTSDEGRSGVRKTRKKSGPPNQTKAGKRSTAVLDTDVSRATPVDGEGTHTSAAHKLRTSSPTNTPRSHVAKVHTKSSAKATGTSAKRSTAVTGKKDTSSASPRTSPAEAERAAKVCGAMTTSGASGSGKHGSAGANMTGASASHKNGSGSATASGASGSAKSGSGAVIMSSGSRSHKNGPDAVTRNGAIGSGKLGSGAATSKGVPGSLKGGAGVTRNVKSGSSATTTSGASTSHKGGSGAASTRVASKSVESGSGAATTSSGSRSRKSGSGAATTSGASGSAKSGSGTRTSTGASRSRKSDSAAATRSGASGSGKHGFGVATTSGASQSAKSVSGAGTTGAASESVSAGTQKATPVSPTASASASRDEAASAEPGTAEYVSGSELLESGDEVTPYSGEATLYSGEGSLALEMESEEPLLQRHRGEAYVPPGWFKPRESGSSEDELEEFNDVQLLAEGSSSKGMSSTASPSGWIRRMALAEGGLSGRQLIALCAGCLVFVVCVASATAYLVVTLMGTRDTSWNYGCRTNFCVRALEMMAAPQGAPNPCDNFYGYVCHNFEHSREDFRGVLRLQRKSDYHENELGDRSAAAAGNASDMLAYAHQMCAQFSHRQNPSIQTMASQMRFSLEDDMGEFLEARTDHKATMYYLTKAAVRMGINTLFNITEPNQGRRLLINARMPDQYRFGLVGKNKLLVHVDDLLRYLWRNKATDFVLQAIVKLALTLSSIIFEDDSGTDVRELEHYVLPPGNFRIGEMIVRSVPGQVNLKHNVEATIFHGDVISQAEAVLRAEKRETANLYLLVMFFDEYLRLVTGSQKTYEEALSCTLLGAKLFPPQYGASEAAFFYDQTVARELREIFENAKVTAAGHVGVKAQAIDVNLNILEPNSFRTERVVDSGTRLYPSHARNILEGLKATMTSMLRRVAEGKYGGEIRSLVEAQFQGTFDFDPRVSSLLVATQNLQPPFYCLNRTKSKLSMGTNHTALFVECDDGKFKPFLNYGLAATSTVEAVLSSIIHDRLHNATDLEERAACYKRQLNIERDVKLDATKLTRNALGLSLSFAMLKTSNMALWRDLQLSGENRTALQLFFYRHCLRHCGNQDGALTGKQQCHLALFNMPQFFKAFGCRDNAPMRPRLQCDI